MPLGTCAKISERGTWLAPAHGRGESWREAPERGYYGSASGGPSPPLRGTSPRRGARQGVERQARMPPLNPAQKSAERSGDRSLRKAHLQCFFRSISRDCVSGRSFCAHDVGLNPAKDYLSKPEDGI